MVLSTLVGTALLFSAHNVRYIKGTHLFISTDILKVLMCHIMVTIIITIAHENLTQTARRTIPLLSTNCTFTYNIVIL